MGLSAWAPSPKFTWRGALLLALVLPQLASATVIYDNYRGRSNIPGGPLAGVPNYANNAGGASLTNLIEFASAGVQNIVSSGTAPALHWPAANQELCSHLVVNAACGEQVLGRVTYALVRFAEAGEYRFLASHDDDLRIDFSTNFSAEQASNYRNFDYNVPVGGLPAYTNPNQYRAIPGKFVVPQANSCYAMRVYWNNRGGVNFLSMQWAKPGQAAEVIPAANLFDPSLPDSYASCASLPSDVGVHKAGPAEFTPGGALNYTIKVWNHGPTAVRGVAVSDLLPDSLTMQSTPVCTASGGAQCGTTSNTGRAWSFVSGLLPVNASSGEPAVPPTTGGYLTYAFAATAAANAVTISNRVSLTSSDENPDNNNSTTVSQRAGGVSVEKTAPTQVVMGQAYDYALTVRNRSTLALAAAVVADQLPPNVRVTAVSGANCGTLPSARGALLRCTLSQSIAAGADGSFTMTADSDAVGRAVNYASTNPAGSGTPGVPGLACNATQFSCTQASTVVVAPPVTVGKSFSPTVISTTGSSLLTLTIGNANSTVDLNDVSLTDDMPNGLVTQGDLMSNTCAGDLTTNGASLNLVGAQLPAGASCVLQWRVASSAVGSYTNTIAANAVRSAEGATNPAPTDATLTVQAPAALSTSKTLQSINGVPPAAGQRLRAGEVYVYAITVRNSGGTAGQTVLTETVPQGTRYTGTSEGWSTSPACFDVDSQCTQTVQVPANGSATVTFTLTGVPPIFRSTLLNTVASSDGDCNDCSHATPVVSADMQATGAPPQTVLLGQAVSMVTTCTNAGTDYGVNATCTVTGAPAGAVTTCTPQPPVAQFQVGAVFTCTTNFTATQPGRVSLVTTARSDTRDVNEGNNVANSEVVVVEPASVQKSFEPKAISTTGRSLLTITIRNTNANLALSSLSLTDTMPSGLVTQGDLMTNTCEGSLVANGASLALTGARLPAGESCVLGWMVSSTTEGSYVNAIPAGALRSAEGVTNTTPTEATLTVRTPAALDASKTLARINGVPPTAGQRLRAGGVFAYAITVRNSGNTAGETVLTETVPQGTRYTGSGEGWSTTPACFDVGSQCTQTVQVPANSSVTVNFTLTGVPPVFRSTLLNTVSSSEGDCNDCSHAMPVVAADMQASGAPPQTVQAGVPVSVVTTCTNAGTDYGVNATCAVTGAPAGAVTTCTPQPPVAQFQVGEVLTCTTSFTPTQSGAITLVTTAGSDTRDPNPDNNAANSSVTVGSSPPPVQAKPVPTLGFAAMLGLCGAMLGLGLRRRKPKQQA